MPAPPRVEGSRPARPQVAWTDIAALVLGGATGMLLIGVGVIGAATWSFPLAFGMELRGDSSYPFPDPWSFVVACSLFIVGVALIASLGCAMRGSPTAHRLSIALLLVTTAGLLLYAYWRSADRRCAFETYSQTHHCMSRPVAAARDGLVLTLPAVLAIVCLVARRSNRADRHER